MFDDLLTIHSEPLFALAHARLVERMGVCSNAVEMADVMPLLLEQLAHRLQRPRHESHVDEHAVPLGLLLAHRGCTVAEIIYAYGDLRDAVARLALDWRSPLSPEELVALAAATDKATAETATEVETIREQLALHRDTERRGFLAHELRNLLSTAVLSYDFLKRGEGGVNGSTGAVLGRSLSGLRTLVDRSLSEVRLESGLIKPERLLVRDFLAEVEVGAAFEATARQRRLVMSSEADGAEVLVDRQTLTAAVGNLLQNAFKFSRPNGEICVHAYRDLDRVRIDVQDECGGLPLGKSANLFAAFGQESKDRSGLGLGLTISQRGIEAIGGDLRVRDLPGKGCIFTIDLPQAPDAAAAP